MEQAKIDRINALARKAKTPEGLTEADNLEQQLEHTYLQRPDGTRVPMKKRRGSET